MIAIDLEKSERCGCGSHESGATLISIDDAFAIIARHVHPIRETDTCDLYHAKGRVLAQDVIASSDAPPFDNAAVDGYALHTEALNGDGPWKLRVVDRVTAGVRDICPIQGPVASQIFTGAPMPPGANAVLLQENVSRSGATVSIERVVKPGANIRYTGEDMKRGEVVLHRGTCISPAEIAAVAAAGLGKLKTVRKVRVGLVITGNEVQDAGANLERGQIWDINTPMLAGLLAHPSIDLIEIIPVKDQHETTRSKLHELSCRTDLIITSGGLSVGEEDHVRSSLAELGGYIDFHGVAIKPGKPVSFGRIGSSLWLGLPGNPLAAFTTWQLFGTAILRGLTGQETPAIKRRNVMLGQTIRRRPERCELRLGRVAGFSANGQEVVKCQDATHSGRVGSLPLADGFILLPKDVDYLPKNAMVEFFPICKHI